MTNPAEDARRSADDKTQASPLDNAGLTEAAQEQFQKAVANYRRYLLAEASRVSAEFSAEHSVPEVTASDVLRARERILHGGATQEQLDRFSIIARALSYFSAIIAGYAANNIDKPWGSVLFAIAAISGMSLFSVPERRRRQMHMIEQSANELTESLLVSKLRTLESEATAAAVSGDTLSDLTIAKVLTNLASEGRWNSQDIQQFRQLLKIRNSIVHGEGSKLTPDRLSAVLRQVDRLQEKLRDIRG
ncbi:MAG: hypothetical protein ACRDRA_16495 [Pseudonocardiaceae bacterium]